MIWQIICGVSIFLILLTLPTAFNPYAWESERRGATLWLIVELFFFFLSLWLQP